MLLTIFAVCLAVATLALMVLMLKWILIIGFHLFMAWLTCGWWIAALVIFWLLRKDKKKVEKS